MTGYGADRVAVLDIDDQGNVTWAGSMLIPALTAYPEFSGPRGSAVSPDDRYLVTFNKVDNTFTRIDLSTLPTTTFDMEAPAPLSIGYDRMPLAMKRGRGFFDNTRLSKSNTSSCFSCHPDGDTDGLAWDLSTYLDPEGTPNGALEFGVDLKGPLVTQRVRSLREVGPFHWRGERKVLRQFNAAFRDLLENQKNGQNATIGGNFFYIEQYLEELALAPNPRQELDRNYTPVQLAGADLFINANAQDSLSCASCHELPLGTNNEIVETRRGGLSPSIVVPALRDVNRKLNEPLFVGGNFGMRTELGTGLNHGGTAATIEDVALELDEQGNPLFAVNSGEASKIANFLEALDTGLAPSTGFQVTMHSGNAASVVANELAYLISQAEAGHCDLTYVTGPGYLLERVTFATGMYDPRTDSFLQGSDLLPPLSIADFVQSAQQGRPVTFFGVPGLRGRVMGIDRDNDEILDLDESLHGTDPENFDSDNDSFPDGYEVRHGTDPRMPNASVPDTQLPSVVSGPDVIYATQTSVKLEFETDEPVRASFFVDGQAVLRRPLDHQYDTKFSLPIGGLTPETNHSFLVELTDPMLNLSLLMFDAQTGTFQRPRPVHVETIDVAIIPNLLRDRVRARVELGNGQVSAFPGYEVDVSIYYESPQGLEMIAASRKATTTGTSGIATIVADIPRSITPGSGEVIVVVQGVEEPANLPSYVEGNDEENAVRVDY